MILFYTASSVYSQAWLWVRTFLYPHLFLLIASPCKRNKRTSTQYYAALGFIPKICISLASGISFLILDQLDFQVDSQNSEAALGGLLILYGLVPCIIKFIASIFLFHIHKHQGEYYANFERSFSNGTVNVS